MSIEKEQLYNELVECLDNLVKIYRSLLDVVRREKDILIASQLDELTENNKAKEALLIRIRTLENQRTRCAREFAKTIGADSESPRLLDLASHSPGPWSDKLRNMHNVLDLLVKRLSELNKGNEDLVKSALSTITGAMEAVRDGLKPKTTYARQGTMAQGKTDGGQLVRREA